MKIGLVLSFRGTNYGMMLQAFATQVYLDLQGIESEIITIDADPSIGTTIRRIVRHFSPTALSASMRKRKRRSIIAADPIIASAYKQRVEVGRQFVATHMHDIVSYAGYAQAAKAVLNKYDCVLIGSDQQWAPACFYSPLNTLMFVPDEVTKASYATSMGVSKIPVYTRKKLERFISRMAFVSVREETGRQIIQTVTGRKDVEVVADPTFLLSCDEWKAFLPDEVPENGSYIFCYFLGDSNEPIRVVNNYAQKQGLKVIAVRNIESYSSTKIDYGTATVLEAPSVNAFVNYARHAKLVCTDSFHGTVFSIINATEFVTFYRAKSTDKNSRNSRVDDLLQNLGLQNRIYTDAREFSTIADERINYTEVQAIVEDRRNDGRNYLGKICAGAKNTKTRYTNVTEFTREECCGCTSCTYVCPRGILSMKQDDEGFLYPSVSEPDKCLKCRACVNQCPVHNRKLATTVDYSKAYFAYNTDKEACQSSSSGGVAAGLYKRFAADAQLCCGASYSADFKTVQYSKAGSVDEISKFYGSKYIKTLHGTLFTDIQQALREGKQVILIGLPCDIAALKNFLKANWENLYTCEVICHGATTPRVLENFVDELEKREGSRIVALNCRAKKPYWKPYYISTRLADGRVIDNVFADSALGKAFQAVKRPSCYECAFKDGSSCSDMIIGDYHGAKQGTEEYSAYGVSICFPVTQKGEELLRLLEEGGFKLGPADKKRAMGNKALRASIEKLGIRKHFIKLLSEQGLDKAANDPITRWGLKYRSLEMKAHVYEKAILARLK